MQTIIYRMDKQQNPTVWHMELYSISCNKLYGKEYENEYGYIYISELLCCVPETNTTL